MKILLCLVLFSIPVFCQMEPETEVILDKEKYLVGESINILVTYFNNTSSTINLQNGYIKLEMITESGEHLKDISRNENKLITGSIKMLPEDEISFLSNLIDKYGFYNKEMMFAELLPGKYTLNVYTNLENEMKLIKSFNVVVTIPEGIDKEAFDAWALALKHLGEYSLYEKYNHPELLEKVFEKYPNSIYSPFIYDDISTLYSGKSHSTGKYRKKLDDFYVIICEEYFTSDDFHGYLLHIISQMSNKDEKLAYLDKLIAKNQLPTMRGYMQQIKREVIAGKWNK